MRKRVDPTNLAFLMVYAPITIYTLAGKTAPEWLRVVAFGAFALEVGMAVRDVVYVEETPPAAAVTSGEEFDEYIYYN